MIDLNYHLLNIRNRLLENSTLVGYNRFSYFVASKRMIDTIYKKTLNIYDLIYTQLEKLRNNEKHENRVILDNTRESGDDPFDPYVFYEDEFDASGIYIDINAVKIESYYVSSSVISSLDLKNFLLGYSFEFENLAVVVNTKKDNVIVHILGSSRPDVRFELSKKEFFNFLYSILKNN